MTCEYCRSRVDYGREECKNCGAPVARVHPMTNVWGGSSIEQNMSGPGSHSPWDPSNYWAQAQVQNSMMVELQRQQNLYVDEITRLLGGAAR